MNENPKWKVARLEDFERRGAFIPVREFLGIHSFGMNVRVAGEDGTLVNEHAEIATGQEEVYVVLDGTASFQVDGETFDAPAGTFISVQPGVSRKATGDATVLVMGGTHGEAYEAFDWGEAWRVQSESMEAYVDQRHADALDVVRKGLEQFPDHPGLNYNYACLAALLGEADDETFDRLRRSVEAYPPFRDQARGDDDFDAIRDDPRFEKALA